MGIYVEATFSRQKENLLMANRKIENPGTNGDISNQPFLGRERSAGRMKKQSSKQTYKQTNKQQEIGKFF